MFRFELKPLTDQIRQGKKTKWNSFIFSKPKKTNFFYVFCFSINISIYKVLVILNQFIQQAAIESTNHPWIKFQIFHSWGKNRKMEIFHGRIWKEKRVEKKVEWEFSEIFYLSWLFLNIYFGDDVFFDDFLGERKTNRNLKLPKYKSLFWFNGKKYTFIWISLFYTVLNFSIFP